MISAETSLITYNEVEESKSFEKLQEKSLKREKHELIKFE
jgi:hypothetical protein